jgi:hypothetical protein
LCHRTARSHWSPRPSPARPPSWPANGVAEAVEQGGDLPGAAELLAAGAVRHRTGVQHHRDAPPGQLRPDLVEPRVGGVELADLQVDLGDARAGAEGPLDLGLDAGLRVEGERRDHRRMGRGEGERVPVQPRGHPRPVGVGERRVVPHPQPGQGGEPFRLAGPVQDRPRRVEPVEVGPHLRLDPLRHEVDVQVDDAR